MFIETKKESVITMTNNYFSTPKYLAPLDDSSVDEDFSVLTDRATIKYISKNLCDSLHHPVTILDINRLQGLDNETLRIDSDIEYFSLRSSCRLLRHCGGSDRCHICDRYHANIFKKYLQQSPVDFLNAYRLEVSRHLLKGTSYHITQIATSCGFNHLSYFSKMFMDKYGCTPSEYRKS